MTTEQTPDAIRRRGRRQLVLIALLFLAPAFAALLVSLTGWMPGTRGNGLPIQPQRSFLDVPLLLEDGSRYDWVHADEPLFTLLALPGPGCAERCRHQLSMVRNARVTLNRLMHRVRLIHVGDRAGAGDALAAEWRVAVDSSGQLAEYRPTTPDSLSVIVVQSNGTALSLYPDGFDPSGLRKDLKKVVK